MTSQSDEKDLEEINFSLTPFNIFRYQRREKGVHLTLKREKNFMTRWNVNTHLHHQKELCANEVEENIFLIFMIVIICDNLNGIFMLIFFRLIKKTGFYHMYHSIVLVVHSWHPWANIYYITVFHTKGRTIQSVRL